MVKKILLTLLLGSWILAENNVSTEKHLDITAMSEEMIFQSYSKKDAAAYAFIKSVADQDAYTHYVIGGIFLGLGGLYYFFSPISSNQDLGVIFGATGAIIVLLPSQYELMQSKVRRGKITPYDGLKEIAESDRFNRLLGSGIMLGLGLVNIYLGVESQLKESKTVAYDVDNQPILVDDTDPFNYTAFYYSLGGLFVVSSVINYFSYSLAERYFYYLEDSTKEDSVSFSLIPTYKTPRIGNSIDHTFGLSARITF